MLARFSASHGPGLGLAGGAVADALALAAREPAQIELLLAQAASIVAALDGRGRCALPGRAEQPLRRRQRRAVPARRSPPASPSATPTAPRPSSSGQLERGVDCRLDRGAARRRREPALPRRTAARAGRARGTARRARSRRRPARAACRRARHRGGARPRPRRRRTPADRSRTPDAAELARDLGGSLAAFELEHETGPTGDASLLGVAEALAYLHAAAWSGDAGRAVARGLARARRARLARRSDASASARARRARRARGRRRTVARRRGDHPRRDLRGARARRARGARGRVTPDRGPAPRALRRARARRCPHARNARTYTAERASCTSSRKRGSRAIRRAAGPSARHEHDTRDVREQRHLPPAAPRATRSRAAGRPRERVDRVGDPDAAAGEHDLLGEHRVGDHGRALRVGQRTLAARGPWRPCSSGPRAIPNTTRTPQATSIKRHEARPLQRAPRAARRRRAAPRAARPRRRRARCARRAPRARRARRSPTGCGRARTIGQTPSARHTSVAMSGPDENENGAHRPMPWRAASPPSTLE